MTQQKMTTPKIDSVIFDIGKVLVDFNPPRFLKTITPDEQLRALFRSIIFLSPDWAEADRGLASDEETLSQFIQAAPEHEETIRYIYEHSGEIIIQFPYAVPWVQELQERGFRVYALSNYSRHLYDRSVQKMEFLSHMDGVVFSWQCHSIKPEEEIYRCLFRQYQIDPSRAVFLDDNLQNIEKARELGMQGILFTGYDSAKKQLDSLLR